MISKSKQLGSKFTHLKIFYENLTNMKQGMMRITKLDWAHHTKLEKCKWKVVLKVGSKVSWMHANKTFDMLTFHVHLQIVALTMIALVLIKKIITRQVFQIIMKPLQFLNLWKQVVLSVGWILIFIWTYEFRFKGFFLKNIY
jgi:hypothetical protein